ncbi:MAG: C4-type zinc ribbon domain-containing protein [Myxococcota bacterium]
MDKIHEQLQDHKSMLEKLVADLNAQRVELEEMSNLKNQRQLELTEADERHNKSKERLMNVSSTKEYNAVEKEMDQLKRKSEETREQLEHLKEAIDLNEAQIAEKESKISTLRDQINGVEQKAEGQIAVLHKELEEWESKRKEARKGIKTGIIRRYDFIRSRRGGRAIVAARDAHCEGCFMAIPPQLYIQIQRGETLESCPSCQRILFYYEDALQEG